MKKPVALFACLFLLLNGFAQQLFQLAPPSMQYSSVFFKKQVTVKLDFREPGAVIRYTLNNTEPGEKSPLYTKPLIITRNKTTLKARSFSKKYLPSATVENTFLQAGWPVTVVNCTNPNEKYKGGGAAALTDNQGGNAAASAGGWLGFKQDTINVELQLLQQQKIKEIIINFLEAEGSWIFMPSVIIAYVFNDASNQWQLLAERQFSFESPAATNACVYANIKAQQPVAGKKILLKIVPLQSLPQWHDGKGQPAWVFMDEIKVY